jgi:DNA-binding NarL/FixJ family response regulator
MAPTRVLVVEDDVVTRAVLRDAIGSAADLELVGEAATAAEAVALAHEAQPDVVILDHHLPGEAYGRLPMQGVEAVDFLRDVEPAPRVVVFSASAGIGTNVESAGADAFVVKSGDCTELLDVIRSLCQTPEK